MSPLLPSRLRALALGALLLALSSAALDAQTLPARADEPVQLSPFEVSTQSDSSYVASESMTGTRVATKIIELPFSVNVLTSEFFEDFAMFELGDNIGYISSFSDLDQGGSFNLRGFRSTVQLRDGFFRLGRYGASNIDRIEVIKGPSAAIYGATAPGGMVNMISKKPRKRTSQRLSVSVGSFDTQRETLEATGTLDKSGRTSYLAVFGYYNRADDTPLADLTNKEGYLALQHDFSAKSNLVVQAEYAFRTQEAPTASAPIIQDDRNTATTTDDQIVGIAHDLTRLQQFGTKAYLNRGMNSLTAIYANALTPQLNFRASANLYHAENENYGTNIGAGTVNARTLIMLRGAAPEFGAIYEDGGGVQTDLLADYRTGRVAHRTLVTIDFNDYYRDDPAYQIAGPDLAAWTAIRPFTVTPELSGPAAPIPYLATDFNPAQATQRRANKNRTTVWGTLLRQQSVFFDGRLLAFAGARLDYTKYSLRNLQANPVQEAKFDFTEFTPNAGISYKVTPHLRAFLNYSEGFTPNAQTITAASINPDYQSEESQGFDYGFKGNFLDDRLNFTINAFRIERQNVVVNEIDPVTGLQVVRFEGSQLARGVEFEMNWRFTPDFSVGGSAGYIDSQITDLGFQTNSVGRPPARISPYTAGAFTRYAFSQGSLKGLSANLGATFFSRTPTEAPNAGDTYTNGVFVRTTNQWQLNVPSATILNAGVRYVFGTQRGARLRHSFGFNVNNLIDREYLKSSKAGGERRSAFFNYTISH